MLLLNPSIRYSYFAISVVFFADPSLFSATLFHSFPPTQTSSSFAFAFLPPPERQDRDSRMMVLLGQVRRRGTQDLSRPSLGVTPSPSNLLLRGK